MSRLTLVFNGMMCGVLLGLSLSSPSSVRPALAQDGLPDEVLITFDGGMNGESCVPFLTTPLSVPDAFDPEPVIIASDAAFPGLVLPACEGSLFNLNAPEGVTWSSVSFDYEEPLLFVFIYAQPGDTDPLFAGDTGGSPFIFSGEFRQISFSFLPLFDNLRLTRVGGSAPPNPPRIDPDNLAAPVAAFCTASGGGVDLYTITPDSEGVFLARATPVDIVRAQQTVARTNENAPVIQADGVTLWALTSGELQINDGAYTYTFSYAAACGPLPQVPPSALVTPTPEDTFTLVNRPRDE